MAEKNDIVITIKVDDNGAVKIIDQAGNSLDELKSKANSTSPTISDLGKEFLKLGGLVAGAATAVTAMAAGGLAVLGNLAQKGAGLDDLATSFENLSGQAGILGDTLLNNLSTAFGGTATNAELMASANKGLLAGLDPQIFDEVANAARSYADAVGTDAKQEFDAFLQGLARGDDRFLKQRGILLDNEKAFEDYAEKIGTTADKLSELGKAEALREAATRALLEQSEKLGKVQNDVGDAFETVKVAIENVQNEFLQAIGTNEDLKSAFEDIATVINDLDFSLVISGIQGIGAAISGSIELIDDFTQKLNFLQKISEAQQNARGSIFTAFNFKNIGLDALLRTVGGELSSQVQKGLKDGFDKGIKNVPNILGPGNAESIREFREETARLSAVSSEAKREAGELAEALEEISNIAAEAAGVDRFPALTEEIEKAFSRASIEGAQDLAEELRRIGANAHAAGVSTSDFKSQVDQVIESNKELYEEEKRIAEQRQKAAEDQQQNLNILGTQKGEFFGTNLGTGMPSLEAAIASSITSVLGKLMNGGLKHKEDFKQAYQETVAKVWDSVLPGSGELGGALAGLEADFWGHIFGGGRDAENNARKALDQFLAEVFETERLSVLIGGKLTEVFDLAFGEAAFSDGTFDDLLAGLPEAAQQSFEGVGQALNSLLETGEGIGSQIAAVLANNIGGSLNNLQILVSTLGFSFEQMSEAIEASAIKGEISFLEAQSSLIGIQKIAEKGIPEAFGDVAQAFQNMFDAGSKGGRVTIDALQDIAAEARELGLNTLPELQAQLTASGRFTEEQITGLFSALAQSGVDSLEELLNASNSTLIAILSDLQSKDILSEAQTQALDLIETINSIPDKKDVEINLKVNASNADRALIDQVESVAQSG